MRIGIDGRALTEKKAGIGVYTYEIIKHLNDLKDNNEYYIYSDKKVFIDFKLNKNFRIIESNSKLGTLWLYYYLPKKLYQDGIDIFWGTQHVLPKRNRYTRNIRFVLTIHDIALMKFKGVGSFLNKIIHKLFLKKSLKTSDKILTISNATKKDLMEMYDIDSSKISIIYLACNPINAIALSEETKEEIKNKYNLDNSRFIFFLSTIEPRKNIGTLVNSFEILKEKEENKNLKLILSGGLGWKYKKLLGKIENSKYKNDILLTGYITSDERDYFYENAVCFAYPSLYEGFGLPVLEAMTRKQIVVTSNVSSLPEVGGDAAFYYEDVLNSNNLASVLQKVIDLNEDDRNKVIAKGLEQVKNFSWEKTAKETIKILLEK